MPRRELDKSPRLEGREGRMDEVLLTITTRATTVRVELVDNALCPFVTSQPRLKFLGTLKERQALRS